MKKIVFFVITIIMICGIIPYAYAADVVNLDICNGSITIKGLSDGTANYTQNGVTVNSNASFIIRQSNTSPTTNSIKLTGGTVNVTIANITCVAQEPISIKNSSTLNLTLIGENKLTASENNAAIEVTSGNTLNIGGTGKLIAQGGKYGAGIGGGSGSSAGQITINSGEINAIGGFEGAGIGGGSRGNSGEIIINNGTITSTGGKNAAGIGSGCVGNGDSITINNGNISATGGPGGAGIGGGCNYLTGGDGRGNSGIININGGTIASSSGGDDGYGRDGCGIGSGAGGVCEKITIEGSSIIATSKDSIGIGDGGEIYIENSIVNVNGRTYGIGANCDIIKIINSDITVSHKALWGADYHEKINSKTVDTLVYGALIDNMALPSTCASSPSGLSYQWQVSSDNKNFVDIVGETNSVAKIKMSEENDGYYYRCALTNGFGNIVYTNATQCYVLKFIEQPQSISVNCGDIATFTVEALGNCSHQWQKSIDNGKSYMDLDGEIYNIIIINSDLSDDETLYRCNIIASNGDTLASNPAHLTVSTEDIYYIERYYLQNADDNEYTVYEQNSVISTTDTNVTIIGKSYDGFTENVSLGKHSGVVLGDNSLVLERYYDRNTYSIAFDTNGGVVIPNLTKKYDAIITLPTPSRYGYSFEGWYLDSDLTDKANITKMPFGDTTLYAKWNSQSSSSRGTEYKINALTLRNASNYEEIKSIPASSFIAEISVTNLSSVYTDTIIVATYDENGALIDLTYMYASIDEGETAALGTLIKNTNGNVSKVKAFVWSTLNSLIPLAESVEVGK